MATARARKPSSRPPATGPAAAGKGEAAATPSRLGAHYSGGTAVGLAPLIQKKVVIGQRGDAFEREADASARHIERGERAPTVSRLPAAGLGASVRAQEDADEPVQEQEEDIQEEGEEPVQEQEEETQEESEEPVQEQEDEAVQEEDEEPVQEQEDEAVQEQEDEPAEEEAEESVQEQDDEEAVQERAAPSALRRGDRAEVAAAAIRGKGAGEPLAAATRGRLEAGLGVDLGEMRVHRGPGAQSSAALLHARAFTHGRDVWLGAGESPDDVRLMAHEATHVVQQGGVARRQPPAAEPAARPPAPEQLAQPVATAAGSLPAAQEPVGAETPLATGEAQQAEAPEEAPEVAPEVEAEPEVPAEEAPAKAAAEAPSPEGDARFAGVMKRLGTAAQQEQAHEPAAKKVGDARAAAEPAENDRESRAQAVQVDVMAEQEAKKPETESFLAMLRAAIERLAPRNMKQTEDFKKQNKAGQLKETLGAQVAARKAEASGDIEAATTAEPDPASVPEQMVTELPEEAADPALLDLRSKDVLPLPKPEAAISVEDNRTSAEELMRENDIDEEQLERANEPQFGAALEAKKELEAHVEQVPEAYRDIEKPFIAEAEAGARADEQAAKEGMRATREKAKGEVASEQDAAKKKEEEERQKVANDIEAMYEATRKKVEDKLTSLDEDVNRLFDEGEGRAREAFQSHVDQRMRAYKWDRYLNRLGGSLLWAKDKIFGMPDEVNAFFEEGREQYLKDMDAVLVRIADVVETRLKEAKDEIARGKEEIRGYVEALPETLQKAGKEAEGKVEDRFAELEDQVDSKKEELAQSLAQRYQEARDKLDEEIERLKAENQGLLKGFIGKLKEIIEILRNFRDRIMTLLRQGAAAVRQIVKDPIGFLGNLIGAVKGGINRFKARIETHVKAGLVAWLTGSLAGSGLQIPTEFSAKAVFGLVVQILGLTAERLKAKLAKIIGPKNTERLEKAWSLVSTLLSEGPAGLWERAKEFVSDLKETVLGKIRNFVVTKVIEQGVMWVLSLLNPASALLRAIKLIYDVVMFFVNNIDRILDLVEAIVQSVGKIVAGAIDAAASWIEKTLGRMVPVLIGFLASLIGLGGLGAKVRGIVESVRRPVDRAVDKVLKKIATGIKKLLGKGKALAKKGAEKLKALFFPPVRVATDDGGHTLIVPTSGPPRLLIASAKRSIHDFLKAAETNKNIPAENKKHIISARKLAKDIDKKLKEIAALSAKSKVRDKKHREIISLENRLAKSLQDILKGVPLSKFDEKYKLEGLIATYKDMPRQKGDLMTPDHQPQAALLKSVAKLPEFRGRRIEKVAAGHANLGLTINLHHTRHIKTRTYGGAGGSTVKTAMTQIRSGRQGKKTAEEKRKAVLGAVKAARDADAATVLGLVTKAPKTVFADIYKLAGTKKVKEQTVSKVKSQISAGQTKIKAQDIDALGEP